MHGQEATKPRRKVVITRKRVLPDKTKTDAIEPTETAPALKMIMQDSTFDIQVEKSEIAKHFREENQVDKNFGTSNKTEIDDNEDRTEENLIEDEESIEETGEDEEDQPSEDEEDEDEDEYSDESDDVEDENEFEESPPESLPAYEPFFPEITETTDVPVLLLKTTVVSNIEFETKTLTTTRLRTYTFVVTTVAGTDEIVTSTTEVKPQIKTDTVTESLTQYTTLTLLDLDKTDVQPTFLPTLEHNPSSLSNTEDNPDFREEPRNLATRVMSNGVEVIVAGDKTTYPGDKDFKRILPSTLKHVTLKPTTVSDHMLLVLPQETANIESSTPLDPNQFVVKTCLTTFTYLTTYLEKGTTTVSSHEQVVSNVATEERMNTGKILPTPAMGITLTQYPTFSVGVFHTTYTYLNTILDGEQPLIISSQHVVANTVTAPDDYLSLLKPSEVQVPVKDTNTYISTIDLEKTLYEGDSESVISTRDVVTQVVITESVPPPARPVITSYTALDSLQEAPLSTTDVTKTYFVTYTYYNTVTESGVPTIFTNVSTESDVVTEKLLLNSKKSTVSSSASLIPEFDILATRIYYTTFTYFTTLLKENDPKHSTIINSRTKVIQNTVTETLEPSLFDPQYISSLASDLKAGSDRVQKIATLVDGEKVEITVQANEVHNEIAPTKVLPIEKTQIPNSLGMTSLDGSLESSFSSKPNIVTGSTIVFVDDDPFANLETPILQTTKSSVKGNLGSLLASEVVKETKIDVVTSKVKRPAHKSKSKPKVNPSKSSVITTASSSVVEKNSNFKTKKGANKSPHPAAPPQDLLGLGSINMNTLQALTPVLNAMAGYLNKNLRRNDVNITASGDQTKESSNKKEQVIDTQNRSPVYIPVGGALGDEFEIAESQNIATFEWKDPPSGVKQDAPLLGNNGIPISPGDIITANSDVIVGKPGRVGPRLPPSIPLHHEGLNEIPVGMRPPPLPENQRLPLDQVPAQTNVIHAPNKNDYIGPPPPPLSRPKEKFRGEKRKHIPLVAHSQHQHVFGPQQHPMLHPQTHSLNQKQQQQEPAFQGGLEVITSKYHLQTQNQNPIYPLAPSVSIVLPEVIERSTGQPLLVQLQPSQVAFVNIPFNRTTALIYGGSTETHHNGQYFDDPSPYPEPEFNPIEIFKNGLPQYGSVYHTTPQLNQGNQKQVSGVIKVGPYVNVKADPDVSSNEKVPVMIEPTRLDFAKGDGEVSVGVPPLSFGVSEHDGDVNAHIISHENFNLLVNNSSAVVPLRNEVFHMEYPEEQQILSGPINQHFQEDVKFPNQERPYLKDEPRPSSHQQELGYPTEMTEMRPPSQHYVEGQHNYQRPATQQQQGSNFPIEPRPSHQYGAHYPERANQQHYDSELRPPIQQDSNYSEKPRPSSQQNPHYVTEIRPPNQQSSNYHEKSRPSNQQNPRYPEGATPVGQQGPHHATRLGPQNQQSLHYHESSSNQQDLDFLAQMRPPDQQPQSSNHPEESTHYTSTQHPQYPEESRPSQNPNYEESRPSNPQHPRPHQDQPPPQQRPHPPSEDQKRPSKPPSPNRPNKPKYPYPPKRNLLRPRPRPDRPKVSEFMTPPPPGKQYYSKRPSTFKERLPIPLFEVTTPQPPRVNLNKYHQENRFKEVTKDVFVLNDHHEDDLANEDGEVIQESNARPLRPGELPLEVLHKTTTTERVELVRFPDSFQNATQVRFPYDRRPGFVEFENTHLNPTETNYGPVYYGEKESQTEKNDLSFLTFSTRNTSTEKPIIIFIDENGQKTDPFPKKSTGNRSKVTSLPIDTLTSPATPSTSTHQSQTEKPFDFPTQQSSNQLDITSNAKIGVTTPKILLNSGENFGVHLTNLTQQINDMEVLHPPPLIAEEDPKTPSILMEPPKIDISSPGKDIIRVPHTDLGQTDHEESSSTLKPFIPKPSEEMVPPAPETTIGTTEIVLGMNPPPLVSTHKPVITSSNVFSMEVDIPSTTIRNKVRRPGYRPISTSTRRPLKTRKPPFAGGSNTSAITPTPTLKSTTPSMEVIVGQPHFDGERRNESKLTTTEHSLSSSNPVITVATPNEDIITKPIHHAGNEVKIVDEPNKATTTSANKPTPALPTRYITYTKTHTVTITKTTVVKTLGGPPSTMTILVTKTEKSYIIDTVTEFHTLIKPTSIVETVTTTVEKPHYSSDISIVRLKPAPTVEVPQPTVIVSQSISKEDEEEDDSLEDFIITDSDPQPLPPEDFESNESIFVVMTDKNKGTIVKMPKTTAPPDDVNDIPHRDEITDSEASNVLLGGVLIAPINEVVGERIKDRCNPECKASRNELCQKVEGMMRCVCRPGFARMFPDRPCNPTYTYSLNVTVEKIGKSPLKYRSKLSMENSTEFIKLSRKIHEALDRMVMQSDLRDIFHGVKVIGFYPVSTNRGQVGVVSKFYLQLSDNIDETRMEDILKKYLRNSNSSLGGTDVFASSQTVDNLKVQDFNECENSNLHDCSENAKCFNLRGSYTCSCKEGYSDLSENMLYPGRLCSSEQVGCEKCNYHGMCYSRGSEEVLCECFHWYAGDRCQINLKVMLIALVTLGTILFALLMVCIILTCVRRKPKKSGVTRTIGFLPQRSGSGGNRSGGTLDRRAMIEDTSSEDSRSETNSVPPYVQQKLAPKLKPPPAKGALKKASMTSVEHSEPGIIFPDQKDRSLTVMIPRAKYHPAPPTPNLANYTTFDARKPSVPSMSSESKLLSYLDAGPSPQRGEPKRKPSTAVSEQYIEEQISSRKTSGALISAGFEVSATVVNNMGTLGTTCGTEADRSENATLIQKISADLLSRVDTSSQFTTLRKALDDDDLESTSNWLDIPRVSTVSESRSYDETTIPPPMKSFTRSEYDTKSLQHQNDEANTMAERDLGSTFLLPHTHLYKPDRGSDISGFESL